MNAPAFDSVQLPASFVAADLAASHAEGRYLGLVRVEVILPLVGVSAGVASIWAPAFAVVPVAIVAVVVLLRVLRRTSVSDALWYELRAAAEAVRSSAWRYAVCASPFELSDDDDEAVDRKYLARLDEATAGLPSPPPVVDVVEISESMRALRADTLEVRRETYLAQRLDDQLGWYGDRADRNARLARRFEALHVLLAGVVLVAGALVVAGVEIGAVVTVAAAATGAAITWPDVRRYRAVARLYAQTARRLGLMRARASLEDTEAEWVTFVAEVEATIGAEHAQWHAAHRSSG